MQLRLMKDIGVFKIFKLSIRLIKNADHTIAGLTMQSNNEEDNDPSFAISLILKNNCKIPITDFL